MSAIRNLLNGKAQMNEIANRTNILHELSEDERQNLKRILLEMYVDINNVCEKYNMSLIFAGGSALGAVRHKGFIPWDDDLDLMMERKDYEKFKKLFESELSDKYILNVPNYKGIAKERFAKVMRKKTKLVELRDIGTQLPANIFLDIFPIDNVPKNEMFQKIKGTLCNAMMFISNQVYFYKNNNTKIKQFMTSTYEGKISYYIKICIGFLFSFITFSKWYDLTDSFANTGKETDICTIPTGRKHYLGELQHRRTFFPTSLGEFEGLNIKLPGDVDSYLTNLYGDYMSIPPVHKRERHFVVDFSINQENTD